MKITIEHHGYHGTHDLRIIGTPEIWDEPDGYCVRVSPRVAKRLNRAVCGIDGCKCYERVAQRIGGMWLVIYRSGDGGRTGYVRGYYPRQ